MYRFLDTSYFIILAVIVKSNEVYTTKQTGENIQHLNNEVNCFIYVYALKY